MDSLWLIFGVAFLLGGMAGAAILAIVIFAKRSGDCDECLLNAKAAGLPQVSGFSDARECKCSEVLELRPSDRAGSCGDACACKG